MKNINFCILISMFSLFLSCSVSKQGAATSGDRNLSSKSEKSTAMKEPFVHVVFFWLKEPENQEARQKFETSLKTFISKSSYVQSTHIGTPADTNRPVIDRSYTYCLIATFTSKEEQDKYQVEPVHLKFIEESKDLWEKVVVYDSIKMD